MSLPSLIQAMLQPDFYDHPVAGIELVQTHISYVLLTGEYAYKIKKPVNFGFLDFSTLEKRHFFCQEELRLNARLAPDLYLAVLPIYQEGNSYAWQGTTPGEYAVKMRQFPQENLLINLFAQGKLTFSHVTTIAQQLAQFHRQAATNAYISQFGTAEALAQVAKDNYEHTRAYIGRAQTQAQFDATRSFTDQFFQSQQELFQQRITAGKIRECHGDLHLKNICLWQDRIQIFDCIEFNESFRNTDVLYDAAFLYMDLEFRGRSDFANRFLNVYLEETNDYGGLPLFPLFCSLRAYIRAKVTSFLLDDPNVSEAEKLKAQEEAAAYYKLAYDYTQIAQSPLVVLMCGVSGTGKTTVARELASRLGAIHIRSDAVRKHLGGIDLRQRGDSSLYSKEMTQKTYDRLLELAQLLTGVGLAVILDAKYDRVEWRQRVRANVAVPVQIVHCVADEDVIVQRLEQRALEKTDIADATVDLLAQQQREFETFLPEEIDRVLPVQTDNDIDYDGLAAAIKGRWC
ncbi:MAG: AAA family ATPase [Pseudanabaenaceae cyanobacterium]